jgi:nucleoside 2-deoxyribosyltransferase
MPFSEKFDDVYQVGIKQTVEECNLFCERVDEQNFTDSILEMIFQNIRRARFIIADMKGRNPNVFYEVGYAHALNKPIIFITQDRPDQIPFDLNQKPHIIYKGKIKFLKDKLKDRLNGLIEHKVGLY